MRGTYPLLPAESSKLGLVQRLETLAAAQLDLAPSPFVVESGLLTSLPHVCPLLRKQTRLEAFSP